MGPKVIRFITVVVAVLIGVSPSLLLAGQAGTTITPKSQTTDSGIKIEVLEAKFWCHHESDCDRRAKPKSADADVALRLRMTNVSDKDVKYIRPCNVSITWANNMDWDLLDFDRADPPVGTPRPSRYVSYYEYLDHEKMRDVEIPVEQAGWIEIEVYGIVADSFDIAAAQMNLRYQGDEDFEIYILGPMHPCDRGYFNREEKCSFLEPNGR